MPSHPGGRGGLKGVFKQSLSVQVCMQLPIQQSGICNAIAFWFELDLDEETQLSTSPYCKKVLPHILFATFDILPWLKHLHYRKAQCILSSGFSVIDAKRRSRLFSFFSVASLHHHAETCC